MNTIIKAILLTVAIQLFFFSLMFLGGLLDPLLGLWAAGFYFSIVGSYFIFRSVYRWLDRPKKHFNPYS
tara:strand:+ start:1415 stop:1621 length:207 start_codon:yes stop_codon:yes gene_type:complete